MKRIDKYKTRCEFTGEDGERLVLQYDNRGDPYSEGGVFELIDEGVRVGVYLEKRELKELHETIGALLDGMKRR